MPQKVKYVGPQDEKSFRGFHFKRNVTVDAGDFIQNEQNERVWCPGIDAVELPDAIANEALKHRTVFLQWNRPVPQEVKDLRALQVGAMETEGRHHFEHFQKRKIVAEVLLTADSPAKEERREREMRGAQAEMDHGMRKMTDAALLRDRLLKEYEAEGKEPHPVLLVPTKSEEGAPSANEVRLQGLVADLQRQLDALRSEVKQPGRAVELVVRDPEAAEMEAIRRDMQGNVDEGRVEPIKDLGLPEELTAKLEEAGFTSIAELASASREEVLAIPGIGEKKAVAIEVCLQSRGLAFAASEPDD